MHLPNIDNFYKFNLNEEVLVDLSTLKRKELNFKWSLHPGKQNSLDPPPVQQRHGRKGKIIKIGALNFLKKMIRETGWLVVDKKR